MSKYYLLLISILVNIAIVLSLPSIIFAQTDTPVPTNIPTGTPTTAPIITPIVAANPTSTPTSTTVPAHNTPTTTSTTVPAHNTSTPTSAPPPGGAGQLCYVSSGVPVPAVNLDYAQKHPKDIGILTAIGCVPTEPTQFILAVSKLATGMGGGIALLLMIAGAFKMITSAGNPDSVKAGSEQITSAIIGLLFIIFAVLLLKVIGVDILNLPGFLSPKP